MMWAGYAFHWIWVVAFWAAMLGLTTWASARLTPSGTAVGSSLPALTRT